MQFVYDVDNPNDRYKLEINNDNGYNAKIRFNGRGFMFTAGSVYPTDNKIMNFGANGYYWQDIYLSRNFVGENGSVSIDDLINLVSYAKTQGWIQ